MWFTWLPSLQFCAVQKDEKYWKSSSKEESYSYTTSKCPWNIPNSWYFLDMIFFAQPVLVGHGMITKVERHVRHNLSPTAYPPDTSTFVGLLLQLNHHNGTSKMGALHWELNWTIISTAVLHVRLFTSLFLETIATAGLLAWENCAQMSIFLLP